MQIQVRLTLKFLMIVASILLASFFIIKFQFKKNLKEEYYKQLRSYTFFIADMLVGTKGDEKVLDLDDPLEFTGPLSGYLPENISIYTLEGKQLFNLKEDEYAGQSIALQETLAAGEYRFVRGKFIGFGIIFINDLGHKFVVIIESLYDRIPLENLTEVLSFVFLLSILLVTMGGMLFAHQALAPVSKIMNEVDALLPTDMSHRLETTDSKDELSRLVITFNKLLDRIQQVFRIQKMFLSNISHELKNPLNVILSQVEVTLNKDRPKEEYQATLQSVFSDVKELNDVADKLMQMARINADDSTIRFQPLRIDEVIWQTKDGILKIHPEYKINFEVGNLPEQEQKILVNGNEQLLKTALANLMDNGCKFSPDKQVKVRLSFPPGSAMIEISDNGPGIAEEEVPMIFNAFYRSPGTASIKGSGIGLSLVESILKLHRIEMDLKSKPGEGTTFILKFPPDGINYN